MLEDSAISIPQEEVPLSREELIIRRRVIGVFRHNGGKIPASDNAVDYIQRRLNLHRLKKLPKREVHSLVSRCLRDMQRRKEVLDQQGCFCMCEELLQAPHEKLPKRPRSSKQSRRRGRPRQFTPRVAQPCQTRRSIQLVFTSQMLRQHYPLFIRF